MATYFKYSDKDRSRAWRASIAQLSWATGAGHAEQTEVLSMAGLVKMICIRISSVTGNPTSTITFDDAQGNEILPKVVKKQPHNDSSDQYCCQK